ncbi:MAG: hypothetical protein RJA99_1331 [Pseudomonadota bacterium]|jgi:hypothetical protein
MNRITRSRPAAAAVLLAALLGAGCASPRIDGQWSDPSFASRSLSGQTVLVSCRAPDATLARICEQRIADELREAGARPVIAPAPVDAAGGNDAVARAARAAGARSAVAASVAVAGVTQAAFGPSLGFGFGGGFGGGRGGIGFGGIGMSVPLGGVRPQTAYSMGQALVDAESGREMWSVRATSPNTDDAGVQVAELARATVGTMREAGLFIAR